MIEVYYRSLKDKKVRQITKVKPGAWINLAAQDSRMIQTASKRFSLNASLVKDGTDLYEAPRVERDGEDTYIYVRYCSPDNEITSTEPLLLIVRPETLVTVSRKPVPALEAVRTHESTITTQKVKLSLQILANINTGYHTYIHSVTKKIFETRTSLGNRKMIHDNDILSLIDIEEDLNEFLATLQPYEILLQALLSGRYFDMYDDDRELIEDLQLSTNELIELSKSRLKTMQNIRAAYTTIATNNLNRIFRLLTSIGIFLMIPTLISGLYGMNVDLPLAQHAYIFSLILVACLVSVIVVVFVFKKKGWF